MNLVESKNRDTVSRSDGSFLLWRANGLEAEEEES